ncbi:MAG TPA: hypothetical protein DCX53_11120, partial [Anaerolineae bacterium]|nr:hypothetical protein [Anaerolineae bacterium]
MNPHIIDETHPLKEVLVWGEPGCEALLAQLLPKSKSLFFSYYEVTEARNEFRRMQALIEKEGVKVIRAKDAYVRALEKMDIPNLPKSIHELEQRLLKYADEYYETFKDEKAVELQLSRHTISIEDVYSQVRADIHKILKEDIESYGAMNAVKLNYLLSHSHDLPICNIFYGRDQSNTLGNEILISEMRWDIRKPETEIYKTALKELGFEDHIVNIEEGTIEGGDSIILG